jgi:hypothetical protein
VTTGRDRAREGTSVRVLPTTQHATMDVARDP